MIVAVDVGVADRFHVAVRAEEFPDDQEVVDLVSCDSIWRLPSIFVDVLVGEFHDMDEEVMRRSEVQEAIPVVVASACRLWSL